jgi:hypothetical protein
VPGGPLTLVRKGSNAPAATPLRASQEPRGRIIENIQRKSQDGKQLDQQIEWRTAFPSLELEHPLSTHPGRLCQTIL